MVYKPPPPVCGILLPQSEWTNMTPKLNHARKQQLLLYLSDLSNGFRLTFHTFPLLLKQCFSTGTTGLWGKTILCWVGLQMRSRAFNIPVPQTAFSALPFPTPPRGSIWVLLERHSSHWEAGGSLPRWQPGQSL